MGYRSSGNLTVDAMGSIAISGNVIPEEWYKHILKPTTGKPYLLAITILADLVYWHRPTEVRDERTGEVIGWKKKFHGEMLQKSYQEYANKFGESKKTIKLAFDQLVEIFSESQAVMDLAASKDFKQFIHKLCLKMNHGMEE